MSKFKVGDRVAVLGRRDGHQAGKGDIGIVTIVNTRDIYVKFDDRRLNCTESGCNFLDEEVRLAFKSLDNLAVDDVVVDDDGDEYTVGGVLDKMIFLIDRDGHGTVPATVKELKDNDYAVKQDEEELTELTLEQVAKLAKVDVSKLRIKE